MNDFWNSAKTGRTILGIFIVAGYFFTFFLVIWKSGSLGAETVRDLLFLYVGALIGSFTSVVAFHYGTTQGSASKDHIIKEIATTKEPTP